jgi:hypothetical protein
MMGFMHDPPKQTQPMEYVMTSPYVGTQVIAIAPAINVTGSRDFDPNVVSDTMFNELQQVAGITVLPLNKTIFAMQRLHLRSIDSPETAAKVAEAMGADSILMISVTAYDPYIPPTVGMTVQLYTVRDPEDVPVVSVAAPEPQVRALRADGSALEVAPTKEQIKKAAIEEAAKKAAEVQSRPKRHLAASISAVFNGTNQTVKQEIRDFAAGRTHEGSAMGPDRYLSDADAFMRFVCHAMVSRLMEVERDRVAGR